MPESFFKESCRLQACFPVNFAKFLKTSFLQNTENWVKVAKKSKRSNTADYEAAHLFLYKNRVILDEPQRSYCFLKFQAHLLLFCSCGNYNFRPCIALMYIHHPREVFLAGYGWFEGKKLYFNILKFVYITFCLTTNHCHFNHRLCCTSYVAAEDFDCIDLILL